VGFCEALIDPSRLRLHDDSCRPHLRDGVAVVDPDGSERLSSSAPSPDVSHRSR